MKLLYIFMVLADKAQNFIGVWPVNS